MQTYGKPVFIGFRYSRKDAPVFHVAPTHEIEHPWRVCPKSLVVRLPMGRAIIVGMWRKNKKDWPDSLQEILSGDRVVR